MTRPPRPLSLAALLLAACGPAAAAPAPSAGPSFDCRASGLARAARLVCSDPALSALDRQLAALYAQARARARHEHPPVLRAEQRGWARGRDDCWKAADLRACVQEAYQLRIVELQARYRLLPPRGPFRFRCDGPDGGEVVVNYFDTDPPSLVAERGDQTSLMRLAPAASGARYEGRNELFWEHHGEVLLRWGYQAPELHCRPDGP